MADEQIDRIGLGVDLLGGPETLVTLRAIRTEQEAIIRNAGRQPGGSGSTRGGGAFLTNGEQAEKNEIQRMQKLARDRDLANREITEQEIKVKLQLSNRLREVNAQIARRREIEETREREAQQRYLAQRKLRVQAYAQSAGIEDRDFTGERKSFRRYRNDEARDPQTNAYRNQLSEEIQGQRNAIRERVRAEEELAARRLALNNKINERGIADTEKRVEIEQRGYARLRQVLDQNTRTNRENIVKEGQLREAKAKEYADRRRAEARDLASSSLFNNGAGFRDRLRGVGDDPQYRKYGDERNSAATALRAIRIRRDQDKVAEQQVLEDFRNRFSNRVDSETISPRRRNVRNEADAERTRLYRAHIASGGTAANFGAGPPSGGGPPEGPDDEKGGGFFGGLTKRAGSVVTGFLLYQALKQVTFGVYEYTKASIEAAKATSEQANSLKFATEAAGGNLNANRALAESLVPLGFTRAGASQTIAAAARATFRNPSQTEGLGRLAVNVAASRGGGIDKAPEVIEDILGGRDRKYREYFNITPEEIYKEAGKKRLASNTQVDPSLFIGKGSRDYHTEKQQISEYVSALTEEEKEQLRLNYVISQSFRFEGDAAERARTLTGRIDLVSASFYNASANVGAFVSEIRPVKELLDSLASGQQGNIFKPPVLGQSGPESTINNADVTRFASDSTTGSRAGALALVSKVAGSIANNITALNSLVNGFRSLNPYSPPESASDTRKYDSLVAENIARTAQVKQQNTLRQQGRLGFRSLTPNDGDPTKYYTQSELLANGAKSGGNQPGRIQGYIEEIKPVLTDGAKALEEYKKKYQDLQKTIDEDKASGNVKGAQFAQNLQYQLGAERDASVYAQYRGPTYEADKLETQKREDDRKQKEADARAKEQKRRDEYTSQATNALSKLRDAQQGAFRLPGDIGSSIAGDDNPYVKVLADQITAAERMRQQWGFLGKAAVDYFTKLEQGAIARQLNKLEFASYSKSSGLRGQSDKETAERNGPGLSRADQDYLNIQQAIVNKAVQLPQLWKAAAESLGLIVNPISLASNTVRSLQTNLGLGLTRGPNDGVGSVASITSGQSLQLVRNAQGQYTSQSSGGTTQLLDPQGQTRIEGFSQGERSYTDANGAIITRDRGRTNDYAAYARSQKEFAGLSPEVQRRTKQLYADSVIDALKDLSPQQLAKSGLGNVYRGALNVKAQGLQDSIEEERKKALYSAKEDDRLSKQLKEDDAFRAKRIAEGGKASDVGAEADALLLSRTDGIASKDLTLDQFTHRQDALRRKAEAAETEKAEAKAAVAEGVARQEALNTSVDAIRDAILNGGLSMLIQVQNDTQARVDQQSLQELNTGTTPIPLDQGGAKSNPYTQSFDKYGRGGRKK